MTNPICGPAWIPFTWADEIIVVDSHSTDGTERISREFTDRVYQHDFHGFGRLRNEALTHATHDWIFSLDTDERATPNCAMKSGGCWPLGRKQMRICAAEKLFSRALDQTLWLVSRLPAAAIVPQEQIPLSGGTGPRKFRSGWTAWHLTATALQYPFRNIDHYLAKQERYSDLMARRMIEQGGRSHGISWCRILHLPL